MPEPAVSLPPELTPVPPALAATLAAGYDAWRERRLDDAQRLLEQALAEAQAVGSRLGVIQARHHLGNLMFNLRRDGASRQFHDEVLEEGRVLDLTWMVASSLGNLGHVDVVEGKVDDALRKYDQAIAAYAAGGLTQEAQSVAATRRYVEGLVAERRLDEAFRHLRRPADP